MNNTITIASHIGLLSDWETTFKVSLKVKISKVFKIEYSINDMDTTITCTNFCNAVLLYDSIIESNYK